MITLLLVLALLAVCVTRTDRPRAQVRAATQSAGWASVRLTAGAVAIFALRLLVEVCHLIVQVFVLVAQVIALIAAHVEAAGARGEAA
ncbi:MAG: hypothetical protein ABR585_07215 [Gemmatimonadaceae bacterium]